MAHAGPTLLVIADRIHATFGPGAPRPADAILIRDGIVAAIGPRAELEAAAPHAQRFDLRGTTITPGLADAHIHLLDWAVARSEIDLADAAAPEAAAAAVEAWRAKVAPGTTKATAEAWILGGGWNPHLCGGASPDRRLLDRVAPDRPVALRSHDLHALWVNTRALELAGITAATSDPPGGRIVRDAAGEPTGLLLESAVALVERCIPPRSEEELREALLFAQLELHRLGITAVHSFPAVRGDSFEPLHLLEALRAEDRLRLRVSQQIPLPLLDRAVRLGFRSGDGGDWIRIGGVKIFLDGALGSRTAWLREPYVDTHDTGVRVIEPDEFRDAVRRAADAGIAATVHAIGDAAVALALDVLRDPATRVAAVPHRIEHVQLCPRERFGEPGRAGIVCSMQPAHLMTDWRPADRYWGAERSRGAYAFRSLLEEGGAGPSGRSAGAVLAFGSDAPVEPVDPRLGLFAAIERRDLAGEPVGGWNPQERIAIDDALRAYTVGPAVAAGATDRLGHLGPGAFADFVAWDRDPLLARGEELLELRCLLTAIGGEVVWRAGA